MSDKPLNADSDDDEEAYELNEITMNNEQQEEGTNSVQTSNIDARMNALPEPIPPELRPTNKHQGSSNTGPKGVLADFEEAKKICETNE